MNLNQTSGRASLARPDEGVRAYVLVRLFDMVPRV